MIQSCLSLHQMSHLLSSLTCCCCFNTSSFLPPGCCITFREKWIMHLYMISYPSTSGCGKFFHVSFMTTGRELVHRSLLSQLFQKKKNVIFTLPHCCYSNDNSYMVTIEGQLSGPVFEAFFFHVLLSCSALSWRHGWSSFTPTAAADYQSTGLISHCSLFSVGPFRHLCGKCCRIEFSQVNLCLLVISLVSHSPLQVATLPTFRERESVLCHFSTLHVVIIICWNKVDFSSRRWVEDRFWSNQCPRSVPVIEQCLWTMSYVTCWTGLSLSTSTKSSSFQGFLG